MTAGDLRSHWPVCRPVAYTCETKLRGYCAVAVPVALPQSWTVFVFFSAAAFFGLLVSAVVSLLIMFPVSAGSRPATGHADVVVDN